MSQSLGIVIDREQNRKSIVIRKLNELWQYSKFLYILVFLILFLLAVMVIICVLETVIVHSKRYYFLELKEAQEFRKYLRFRQIKDTLFSFRGHVVNLHK